MNHPIKEIGPTTDLATVSVPVLRAELARGLSLTADTLYRLGLIWAELERRGEDLTDLRVGLARTLPLIAAGRLAAEAVVAFANRPALLRAIDGLPIDQQRRYAAGEPVEVIDASQPRGTVQVPLSLLPLAAIRLVFSDGEVRTPAQQRLALRPRTRQKEDESERNYRPRYNREAGTITVGRMTIQLADLLQELSAAAGPDRPFFDDKPEEFVTIKVRLSQEEARRFEARCKQGQLPTWEVIRKAMRAFGLV